MFSRFSETAKNSPFGKPFSEAKSPSISEHRSGRLMAAPNLGGEEYSCEFGSLKYYALCGFGGILSCGITHTAVVPLDLVKCRIQVDPNKYKNILNGFKVTLNEDKARGLAKGWAPTFIGYSMQGLCKFGFYEIFKILYSNMLGEKAFDSLNRPMMFKILKAYGIPPRLLSAIKATYSGTRAKVVTMDGDSDEFEISAGVLQGDTLAPFLFVIVLDYALRKAISGREADLGLTITPRKSRRHPAKALADLDFAGDIVLLSDNISQAQTLLALVEKECLEIGLTINAKKTKVMSVNLPLTSLRTANDIPVETVDDFKYLGSWINCTTQDIKVRKAMAWKALNEMSAVWRSNLSRDLKIRFFRAAVESILLYGCECWSLNSSTRKSLDGTYTRMLRAVLNTSWRDRVPNTILYGDLPRITDRIAWRRLGIAGHCYRHKELPASQLVLWEPAHGWRKQGRPVTTFIDTLKEDTGATNSAELSACMKNRQDWNSRREARLRPP